MPPPLQNIDMELIELQIPRADCCSEAFGKSLPDWLANSRK
jgi:hypothetical protein